MNNILVSVCLTTYNMEDYIQRAIECILAQVVDFSYEIIVADDCSTDDTIRILQTYQQKIGERFLILYADVNKGVVENFSKALKCAKGKYIASLDADDYWIDQYKLQLQYNILQDNREIGFVYTNYNYVPEDETYKIPAFKEEYRHPEKEQYSEYLLHPFISPSTMLFRRDIIDFDLINVFIRKRFISQDYSLFLDFCMRAKGYYLKTVTTHYTLRKGSLSRAASVEKKIEYFKNCYEIGRFFLARQGVSNRQSAKYDFLYRFKVLLASWMSMDFNLIKKNAENLSAMQFIRYNPKALYIYMASHSKILYKIFRPVLLRKRKLW